MPGIISAIEPDSIAEELNWRPGDEIISVNGQTLSDLIDYRFYTADEHLKVLVRRGEQTAEFEIEKDIDTDLGVTLEDALFDGVRLCGANCIFCFVSQLPRGLRKSLYLKDDDYRLSFLHGNFVTLANATDDDLHRIVTQRLSPLYISVHTTDPELRERMLGRRCPAILEQIDTLSQGNITLHTQIVLCRGINDGAHLDRTVEELAGRYPTVKSIAIVPAGITAHRRHKMPIPAIDAKYSVEILCKARAWQHKFSTELGTRLVWAADEFYLSAGRSVPRAGAYEGFPQIQNGIGLVRKFKDSAYRARRMCSLSSQERAGVRSARVRASELPLVGERAKVRAQPLIVSVVTGTLAAPILQQWADSLCIPGLQTNIHPIANRLFGETVTVAGLISGRDVIEQLRGKALGDLLVVPSVALREEAFLDDVTLADLQQVLGVLVRQVAPSPAALLKLIHEQIACGGEAPRGRQST